MLKLLNDLWKTSVKCLHAALEEMDPPAEFEERGGGGAA